MSNDDSWTMKSKPPKELKEAFRLLADDRSQDALAALQAIPSGPGRSVKRRPPTRQVQIKQLYRDSFSCTSCGKALLPVPVLRAASFFGPDDIPFRSNWESGSGHALYVLFAATFDRPEPTASGSDEWVTSCWLCNSNNGITFLDRRLASEPRHPKWRGLVPEYLALEERIKEQAVDHWIKVHRLWMRDLAAAEREGTDR